MPIEGAHKVRAAVVSSDKGSHRRLERLAVTTEIDILEPFLLGETMNLVWIDYHVGRRATHFLQRKELVCKNSNFLAATPPYSEPARSLLMQKHSGAEKTRWSLAVGGCHARRASALTTPTVCKVALRLSAIVPQIATVLTQNKYFIIRS